LQVKEKRRGNPASTDLGYDGSQYLVLE
jgi:hypothetical protein